MQAELKFSISLFSQNYTIMAQTVKSDTVGLHEKCLVR